MVCSVLVGTFRVLMYVAKLPKTINGNVQPVCPVISNTFSEKRTFARSLVVSDMQREDGHVA